MDSATSSYAASRRLDPGDARFVLATVGHELRTPLTSIRGYLETLLGGEIDASTARRFLETARTEALRLSRLVDGMMEFSLLDLSADGDRGRCNVLEQVRATIDMLAPMAAGRKIALFSALPESAHARVDGDAVVHAIGNVLENAIKYGREDGSVEIRCAREEPFVAIAVHDDGRGVAPQAREAIFAMGARATLGKPGNGIGLAVVKAIAQRSGGDVRIERSHLGGACFVVRFPEG